jgi:hypothetical protein
MSSHPGPDPYAATRALLEPLRAALADAVAGGSATWPEVWAAFRPSMGEALDEAVVAHEMLQFEIDPRHGGGCDVAIERHVYPLAVDEPIVCACSLTYPDADCRPALVHGQPLAAEQFEQDVDRAMAASGLSGLRARAEAWLEAI